jgi:M3 family oligoendopeptidase
MSLKYSDMPYKRPALADAERSSAERLQRWGRAHSAAEQIALIRDFDEERIDLDTSRNLSYLRFEMDTRDQEAKAEKEFWDDADPRLTELRLAFLSQVLASPHRAAIGDQLGAHALATWELALKSYDPVIADDRRMESRLATKYTELMSSLEVVMNGESMNLSQLGGWFGHEDRATRLLAHQLRFAALGEHREELDSLYDDMVRLRDGMARKLGHASYVELAYILMRRDYSAGDVEAYRRQVREVLVPLATRIRARHAKNLGIADYAFHDSGVSDLLGVPRPMGDHDWMLERAGEMFPRLGEDFADFWSLMRERELLDLRSREGKAGGGFCIDLAKHGVPFVFANFNGTEDDVNVFTHESGHAFQAWRSMSLPLSDYFVPTFDAAEIHSMGLEMLCHPHVDLFFGDDADRYRRGHLERAILFIPYGVAIDEFQHRMYEQPGLTPDERAATWKELESIYLPERRYSGMPHAASGRAWQVQRHVYLSPFYYIDYCLAQTCALQFWQLADRDRAAAMAAYRRICDVGGSKPFSGIVEDAGLSSPFAHGTVATLAQSLGTVLRV